MLRTRIVLSSTVLAIAIAGSALNAASPVGHADTVPPRASTPDSTKAPSFPDTLPMPTGSIPEGIAIGKGAQAFVTSLADGSIHRLDLRTGTRRLLSPATGVGAVGITLDARGRLFVAGGTAGTIRVLDSRTGRLEATYNLAGSNTFINDVVVADDGVYATDSISPVLYRIPLVRGDALPEPAEVKRIPLHGITYVDGFNVNGITTTPDGSALLVVQTNTGVLYRVHRSTGLSTPVDLGGEDLAFGDGLLLEGRMLYVVQNFRNRIAVIRLDQAGTAGQVVKYLADPRFDTPTTVARFGSSLYLPNARFTVAQPETADFDVVAITP